MRVMSSEQDVRASDETPSFAGLLIVLARRASPARPPSGGPGPRPRPRRAAGQAGDQGTDCQRRRRARRGRRRNDGSRVPDVPPDREHHPHAADGSRVGRRAHDDAGARRERHGRRVRGDPLVPEPLFRRRARQRGCGRGAGRRAGPHREGRAGDRRVSEGARQLRGPRRAIKIEGIDKAKLEEQPEALRFQ